MLATVEEEAYLSIWHNTFRIRSPPIRVVHAQAAHLAAFSVILGQAILRYYYDPVRFPSIPLSLVLLYSASQRLQTGKYRVDGRCISGVIRVNHVNCVSHVSCVTVRLFPSTPVDPTHSYLILWSYHLLRYLAHSCVQTTSP